MKTKILKISFSNNFIAICAMIIAVVSVTLMSAIAKLIGPEYNPIQIAFIRGIIVIILLLPIINKLGGLKFLYTKKPFLHFFRSIAGVIGNIFFFYSFQRLPIADVTVISMAVPIFSSILAIIFLNEIIGWRRWTAIIFGFTGVVIALDPSTNIEIASIAAIIATLMWSTISFGSLSIGGILIGLFGEIIPLELVLITTPIVGYLLYIYFLRRFNGSFSFSSKNVNA